METDGRHASTDLLIDLPLNCVLNQFASALQSQLFFDMCLVSFYCLDTQLQLFRDLACCPSLADSAKYLKLPVRKHRDPRFQERRPSIDKLLEHLLQHRVAEIHLPIKNPTYRFQYFLRGFLFHDVSIGPGS